MSSSSDRDLLENLGIAIEPVRQGAVAPLEARILVDFEDIQDFVDKHGRVPSNDAGNDILERILAVRLERVRTQHDHKQRLKSHDRNGILDGTASSNGKFAKMSNVQLLERLGGEVGASSITRLRHVRTHAEKRAAEKIANREQCKDFDQFKPLFDAVQSEIERGIRETLRFEHKAEIDVGRFFIVGGQKAYVADRGEEFVNAQGKRDARLRVIFDNGTESDLLMRSLQRALSHQGMGRRITEPSSGPLFEARLAEGDRVSGTIYVLRSKSKHPYVAENRELVHKIGVTSGSVERRVSGARLQPTFLLADVEIIATYELYNISLKKVEQLIHRVFASARLDIELTDRFGNPVTANEWFLVPTQTIDDAIDKIRDNTIAQFAYDPASATLVKKE